MNPEKYNKTISLLCPTCGNKEFDQEKVSDVPTDIVKCQLCGRELTKDGLIKENSENISMHVKEIENQVMKDVSKTLEDQLKKTFQGNKYIKVM